MTFMKELKVFWWTCSGFSCPPFFYQYCDYSPVPCTNLMLSLTYFTVLFILGLSSFNKYLFVSQRQAVYSTPPIYHFCFIRPVQLDFLKTLWHFLVKKHVRLFWLVAKSDTAFRKSNETCRKQSLNNVYPLQKILTMMKFSKCPFFKKWISFWVN